jgi:hypothetical protein
VELSPGVLFEYYSAPLLKASRMGFELYPIVLLRAVVKVAPPFGAGFKSARYTHCCICACLCSACCVFCSLLWGEY